MNRFFKAICGMLAVLAVMQTVVISASAWEETVPADTQAVISTDSTVPSETFAPTEETIPAVSAEDTVTAQAETIPAETVAEDADDRKIYEKMPLYFQTDYPDTRYGNGTIESSGCSITSLAMVATAMTGHEYLPDELADYFGGRAENNMQRLEIASEELRLPWKKSENWNETLKALEEGKIAIALMNHNSLFTTSQHFIVLAGMTDEGKIMVKDPYAPNYDYWLLQNGFANGFEPGDILCGYSGAWIYDVDAMPEEPFIYVEEKPDVESRYPDIDLTYEEEQLLARMIWVEARGESAEGQQAIAEIVFNRMLSDGFPDTVSSVIYAEGQFRSTEFLDQAEPYQAQYDAIERALEGPYVLPVDVVYFAQYPVNYNIWGKIGGHIFCYDW